MRVVLVSIGLAVFCCSISEGRLGLRRRSLLDDDFMKPWSTFDMLSRDFDDDDDDDMFRDDPFYDSIDSFFDRPLLREPSKPKGKPVKDAGKGVCDKKCKDGKDLVIPRLSSRVVLNNDKEFKFAMNVKGFEKQDVSVKIEDDFLKISGRKSCKKEAKKEAKTCANSFFRYQYLLPKHADLSKVKARFSKDGFLIVEMPKFTELDDASNNLQIEEIDEEYLPKLKSELSDKSKTAKAQKDGKTSKEESKADSKNNAKVDEEATVEVL